jgi:hypothetical protein
MNATASAWDKFQELPDQYRKMDVEAIVRNWLVGQYAVTCHPSQEDGVSVAFTITEVKIEPDNDLPFGRIFVRGEETLWFGQNSFKINVCGF